MIDILKTRRSGAQVAVLGMPLDHNSSFLRGPQKRRRRHHAQRGAANMTRGSASTRHRERWCDWGDVVAGRRCSGHVRIFINANAWVSRALPGRASFNWRVWCGVKPCGMRLRSRCCTFCTDLIKITAATAVPRSRSIASWGGLARESCSRDRTMNAKCPGGRGAPLRYRRCAHRGGGRLARPARSGPCVSRSTSFARARSSRRVSRITNRAD
jgi:hypothetical protein